MRQKALPYLLLLPATLFLCVFFLYPFVLVAWEAITRDGIVTLDNFRTMVGHWKFPETLRNTVLLAAIVVPLQLVLALADGIHRLAHGDRPQRRPLHLRHSARHFRSRRRPHLARHFRTVGLSEHSCSPVSAWSIVQ